MEFVEPELQNFRIVSGFTRDYLTLIDHYDIINRKNNNLVETRERQYKITLINFKRQELEIEQFRHKRFKFKLKNIIYPIEITYLFTRTLIIGDIPPKNKWQKQKIRFWKWIKKLFYGL